MPAHLELPNDVVDREAGRLGFREQPVRESIQRALAIVRSRLDRACLDWRPYEGASPTARGEHAASLQLRVDLRDGIGIEAEVDGELSDRRESVARAQPPGGNLRADAALQLRINRGGIVRVDGEQCAEGCRQCGEM